MKIIDLLGQKFDRLFVIEKAEKTGEHKAMWKCLCDCGNSHTVYGENLRKGRTKSCGCLNKEMLANRSINLCGQRFRMLLVIGKTEKRSHKEIIYKCLCDCGKETFVLAGGLRSGKTTSCGCWGRTNRITHGHEIGRKKTREYCTWDGMIQRCTNPNTPRFEHYGGRGIKVCDDWFHSFENFLAYLKANNMYPKPAGLSIDRIENNGNYEAGNIRWATYSQQNHNRRKYAA